MNSLWCGALGAVLLAAACGSVKTNGLADAPATGDGARGRGDATGMDAAPDHGPVTIRVLDPKGGGSVSVGVSVVFVDSAGTQTVATNGSGEATADVHAGASATSVAAVATGFQLQTITELQPGDTAVLGTKTVATTPGTPLTVTVPTIPGGDLGVSYEAFGPCGQSTIVHETPGAGPPPTQLAVQATLTPDCTASPALLVAHAFDANGSRGFVVQPATTLSPPATAAITGAYTAGTSLVGTYSNLDDATITSVGMSRSAPDAHGFSFAQNQVHQPGVVDTLTTIGPTLTGTVVVQTALASAAGNQVIRELVDGAAATYTFDGHARMLPFIGRPAFDVASETLHVPVSATGTSSDAPDLFRVVVGYSRATVVGGTSTTTTFAWTVYGPTPGDITLPAIPTAVGDVMPQAGDKVPIVLAQSLELDSVAGYAQARLAPVDTVSLVNLATNPGTTLVRFSTGQIRAGVE